MFNRTVNVMGSSRPASIYATVTERRAPTDESVRLLREMEAKAREQVLRALRLECPEIECVVHEMRFPEADKVVLTAIFKIGGTPMEAQFTVPRTPGIGPKEIATGLRDEMAKVLASQILAPAFSRMASTSSIFSRK